VRLAVEAPAMSKRRPGLKRHKNDLYQTPYHAVPPLIPWLRGIRTFAEPCCGDGDMVRHLESFGLRCVYAGDLSTGQDALASTDYNDPDVIITNPPYTRSVMHPMIEHFRKIAPTWLLLEQDWCGTKQATPLLRSCTDMLPIGRVQWMAEKKGAGFDNSVWARFDAHHTAGPVWHSFRAAPPQTRQCVQCERPYQPQRSDSCFCSNGCRQRAYRERLTVTQP
jgi:hypothetical protein